MKTYSPGNRTILRLKGSDNLDFLNRLVTQDLTGLSNGICLYSLLLNAQGRYLHDFFILSDGSDILIDVYQPKALDLIKRLSMYKMRSDVEIIPEPEMDVRYAFDLPNALTAEAIVCVDPRHKDLGLRLYSQSKQTAKAEESSPIDYEKLRLSLGIPETDKDLIFEKSIPLECGFDDLNAISFTKGCYLGQELTTRTKHQGLVRKRLLPVLIEGPQIEANTDLFLNDKKVGSMRSSYQEKGIALIRLEVFSDPDSPVELLSNTSKLTASIPSWHQI